MKSIKGSAKAVLMRSLAASALVVTVGAAGIAAAQESGAEEEVVVTGTRITVSGFTQPTPVTVVTGEQLDLASPGTLSESLAPLPELRLSTNPQGGQNSSSNMGAISQLNLRGLGVNRTLVLLDGRRMTPANTGSAPDINMLPQMLVNRVEIVTGGASAAYGSDAVSGVVNFFLDETFEGLKIHTQYGISDRGDADNVEIGAAFGASLLGGRMHIIGSAEYYDREAVYPSPERGWTTGHYLPLTNPNVTADNPASPSNPNFIISPNATVASGTPGGLITSGPFANTEFINGQPDPFTLGALRTSGFMQGGDGVWSGDVAALALPLKRNNQFVRLSYELSPALRFFISGSRGEQESPSTTQVTNQTFTIFSGNPFIPEGFQQQMTDLGVASIPLSKFNLDVGGSRVVDTGANWELMAGLEGEFALGERAFDWNASYQTGNSTYGRVLLNNIHQVNMYNAADSVVVTEANQGSSGLPIGSIACRTTLSVPDNGCVPLDPFIPLSENSQAGLDYINFIAWFEQSIEQQSVQAAVSGEAFDNWAGTVTMAAGAEYRSIDTVVTSDPLSRVLPATVIAETAPNIRGLPGSVRSPNPGVGRFGNFQPLAGGFDVTEAFVEVNVPLARGAALADGADLNAAYRVTDYSTSGKVDTWKVGLTWDITDEFRVRATRSRDIRAPNIVELLSPSRQQGTTVTDPVLNNAAFTVTRFDTGNSDLAPEEADTLTVGFVYRSNWIEGLHASVDGYDIQIDDAIVLLVAQDVVDGCYGASPEYCALITRTDNSPTGAITGIRTTYFNTQEVQLRGVDIELSYNTELSGLAEAWAGALTLRALASYTDEYSVRPRADLPAVDKAGEVGSPTSGSSGDWGVPHWTGTFSATYDVGDLTLHLQERYVGGGNYDNMYNTDQYNAPGQAITYINDNSVPARWYADFSARYDFGGEARPLQIIGTVTNLFDQDPPNVPSRASTLPTHTNGYLYDTIGRRYTIGLRARF